MMTELSTRDFISQWPYDHGNDVRDETAMHWRSVDLVAEHVRQRESHLEDNFGDLDFEKRVAAMEAYFLGAPRPEPRLSERKLPPTTKAVPRVRPQSAYGTRRVNANNYSSVNETRGRPRPQSAKYRSEVHQGDQKINRVDWNAPAQSKNSKWREMLARGPEFEQLSLRKLELETYELLSRTFVQRSDVDVQSSARRRRKGMKESNADSKELARGSGLHLARSRKKRQQEHDREMMLGKGRQSSRRSERDRRKSECEDKTIQDKTRRRDKLLKKRTIQKPPQETQPAFLLPKQDKQPLQPYFQRPTSAYRTRSPCVPSSLASSEGTRCTPSGNIDRLLAQNKRIAQLLEAFQRMHLRPKNTQKQLKNVQRSTKTARSSEPRKTEQILKASPDLVKCERPSSASTGTLLFSRGNQEDDRDQAHASRVLALSVPVLQKQPPYRSDALFSESPDTPKLVIPPLKFPTNLCEHQHSQDTQDGSSERYQCRSCDQPSVDQEPANSTTSSVIVLVDECQDIKTLSATISDGLLEDGMENQTATSDAKLDRGATIEEGYLAESLAEKATIELSTGDSESSRIVPHEDFQDETSQPDPKDNVNDELFVSRKANVFDANMDNSDEDTQNTLLSNEVLIFTEVSRGPKEEADSPFPETNTTFQKDDVADTLEVSDYKAGEPGMKAENVLSSSNELQSSVELSAGENLSIMVANQMTVVGLQPSSGDLMEVVGYNNDSESERSARGPTIVHEVKPMSVSLSVTGMESEQDYTHAVASEALEVVVTNGEDDTVLPRSRYIQLPETSQNVRVKQDIGSDTASKEKQDNIMLVRNSEGSLPEPSIQNPSPDVNIGGPNQFECSAMVGTNDVGQLKWTVECGNELLEQEYCKHTSNNGESSQPESAIESSNALLLDHSNMKMQPIEDTTQSGTCSVSGKRLELIPTKDNSPAPSPKKKTKETKAGVSDGSAKKKKPVVAQSTTGVVDIATAGSLPVNTYSPDVDSSNSDQVEEESLRVHQQEVTRSFLKRISSRKLVEPESSSSSHVESQIDQAECSNALGATESEIATAVMDETPFKQNVKPVKERDPVSLLQESTQALNTCESTIEKYPPATDITATSDSVAAPPIENVDMGASFASASEGSSLASMMASIFDANPKETDGSLDAVAQTPCYKEPNSFDDEDIPLQERSQPASITSDNVIPRSDAKEIVDESPTLSADHHNMANKIQAQYRCFVRRRIILDQLRFILAKQRRKARKSRLKVKKAKTVDKDASDETAVVHVAADANSMDNLPEGVQQVAPTSMRSEIGGEITSAALVVEPSEPTMARKDSCDYAFDLFDDAEDVNGEVMQEAAAVEDKLPMEVVIHTDVDKPSSEKLYDQLLLSKRDVMVTSTSATTTKDVIITSISATATIESLQVEEDVLFKNAVVRPNKAMEVESGNNLAASPGTNNLSSTLTFLDVEEKPAKPVDAVFVEALKGTPRAQPHWERYVDSTTSDSFYYNPSTNETQWTAPQKDRANAAINSSRVTPTTPQSATATADAVVSPNGQPLSSQEATGTWQEFLDEATGHLYYYNTKTGECSWEPPASSGDTPGVVESLQSVATAERASPWIMYFDPASQAPYYVNTETMATSWEQPEEFTTAPSDADMYVFAVEDHSALEI